MTFTIPPHSTKKQALQLAIEYGWTTLNKLDQRDIHGVTGTFAMPVSDAVAPGYSAIIKDPISLDLMRVNKDR